MNARLFDFAFAARTYDFLNSQQTGKKILHLLPKLWGIPHSALRFPSRYFAFFPYFGQFPDPENTLPELSYGEITRRF